MNTFTQRRKGAKNANRPFLGVFASLREIFFRCFLVASLTAQAVQAPQPGFIIRTNADLVLIDVQVLDRSGKPVKGLKAAQFKILEDGKPQNVSSFDYYDIENMETVATAETKPMTLDLGTVASPEVIREVVRDRRLTVLFYDLTSLQPDELLRSIDAGKKFLKDQMTPADMVGIISFGNRIRILSNFTNDRDALAKALAAVRPGKDAALAAAAETDTTSEEAVTEDSGAAYTADETEFNIFNTDRKLAAMEALAELLKPIPAKKSVVQFTGGVSQTGQENRSQLRAATDAANRANVSFYTVDARGLQANAPGGDASVGAAAGNAMYRGNAVFRQAESRSGSRETLATLATDTGGQAFTDLGDFSEVFATVQTDTSGYYLLGYNSTNPKMDGHWRKVVVKLEAAGYKVRFRDGYYAPKDYKVFTTQDRERQLGDAMLTEVTRNELPLAVETTYFRLNSRSNEIFVPVSAKLAASALEWAEKKGRKEAEFDFAAEFREVASNRVVGALRDTIKVKLDADRFKQVSQRALVYQGGVILGPGNYKLKFLARENETGHIGTFEQTLRLPPWQGQYLQVSSILLSSQVEAVRKSAEVQTKAEGRAAKIDHNPLEVGGERVIPSVTRVFTSDQRLYVVFQAYFPQKTDPSKLRAGLVLFRNGVRASETPLVEAAEMDVPNRTASFRISLPLEKLPPGRYTVQAVTVEAGGDQSAFARSYFALRAPSPPPAAKPVGE